MVKFVKINYPMFRKIRPKVSSLKSYCPRTVRPKYLKNNRDHGWERPGDSSKLILTLKEKKYVLLLLFA